jgi:hypothetical protein
MLLQTCRELRGVRYMFVIIAWTDGDIARTCAPHTSVRMHIQ